MRTFGCYVVFTLTDQERVRGEKFHAIGIEGAFLGYEENRVGYRVWHPEKRIVLFRINVYFDETKKGIFKKSESNEQAQSEEETLSFGPILEAEGQPTLAPEHADPLLSDHPDPVEDLPMEDPVLQQGVPELEISISGGKTHGGNTHSKHSSQVFKTCSEVKIQRSVPNCSCNL